MAVSELTAIERARAIFRENGGVMRMSAALRADIHRETLEKLVEQGDVQRLSRGLYHLVEVIPPSPFDLAIVAAKVSRGIVCLISALSFHEMTTQIPHEVYLAVERNARPPRLDYPPIRTFRFSGDAYSEGIEVHDSGPVQIHIYSREKTLADCFKYRNKIGLDTCLEALQMYKAQGQYHVDAILRYASICRVKNIMRPYLEATL